jgi:hypothetical protein
LVDAYAALDRITQGPPIPVGSDATEVTSSGATLAGTVNPHRLSTTVRFQYGTAGGATASTPDQAIGNGKANVGVSAPISGLLPNATYTYRVVASNGAGTAQGEDRTFTTASVPPVAATGAASAITTTGAKLAGTADPRGTATSAHFEFGPSTAYGSATAAQSLGAGRATVDVTASLTALQPATTYHYRLVTTNTAGTTQGDDQTFTTASPAVIPPPPAPPHTTPPHTTPPAAPHPTPPPAPVARAIALTLSGRTLRVAGADGVTQAVVRVRKGRRTLLRRRPAVRAGAMKLRLRWSDVRNGRIITVSLGGSNLRVDLQATKVRLKLGGTFTRATAQVRRRATTLAEGALAPPAHALTLRLDHKRRPRTDRVVVVVQAP